MFLSLIILKFICLLILLTLITSLIKDLTNVSVSKSNICDENDLEFEKKQIKRLIKNNFL